MSASKPPARRNPLLQKAEPLAFDNVSKTELVELTDDQKADRFMSRWMEIMRPFTTFKKAFAGGEKDYKRILKEIKNFYTRYVLREGWEEKKYVMVINAMLEARSPVGPFTIERFGKMYDDEELPDQIRERRRKRR